MRLQHCLDIRDSASEVQTGVVAQFFKKGNQRVCSNYKGITLFSFLGKVYAGVLERIHQAYLCSMRNHAIFIAVVGNWTNYTLSEECWRGKGICPTSLCFVDLEKVYDCAPVSALRVQLVDINYCFGQTEGQKAKAVFMWSQVLNTFCHCFITI